MSEVLKGQKVSSSVIADEPQWVYGETYDATVQSGGYQYVSAGGLAVRTRVQALGSQHIFSGGKAANAIVYSQGSQYVAPGAVATGTVLSGGYQDVVSGGIASSTRVLNGAQQYVFEGGSAIKTHIAKGAVQSMFGTGSGAAIYGIQSVYGKTTGDIIYKGGVQTMAGDASNTQVKSGGSQVISGGSAIKAIVSKGGKQIVEWGLVSGGVVSGGASQIITGSATIKNVIFRSRAAQHLRGGTVVGGIFSSGARQVVSSGGVASKTTLRKGGTQTIYAGGSAYGVVISSGGAQIAKGTASNGISIVSTRILKGGKQTISTGVNAASTRVSSGGMMLVASGGRAYDAWLGKGATMQINKGGSGHISAGAGATVDLRAGGYLQIWTMNQGMFSAIANVKIKVQGTATMQTTSLRNATVTGTKNAQLKGDLVLENNNNFKAVTINAQNSGLQLTGTGNKVEKYVTNANTGTSFILKNVKAADKKYMLTVNKKNTLGGNIYVMAGPEQQFGTYELASNLNLAKGKAISVDIAHMTDQYSATIKKLDFKIGGKAQTYAGTSYALNYKSNKLTLTVTGVKGQFKKSAKSGTLNGTVNHDIFYGGTGNDVIVGNGGRDVAVYDTRAWGKDRIDASGGSMTIIFSGVKSSQITKKLVDGDMVITRKGKSGQSITIENWDAATHKLVFGGTMGQFSKYAAAAKPTATQKNQAFNEVWKKAGMLA